LHKRGFLNSERVTIFYVLTPNEVVNRNSVAHRSGRIPVKRWTKK